MQAMIARIGYELGSRTDLVTNGSVQSAINDAIQIYQKERFRFNELQPIAPFVINTVQGQAIYTVADDARIPTLYKIDYINYLLGNTVEKMDRGFPEEVYLALQNIQMAVSSAVVGMGRQFDRDLSSAAVDGLSSDDRRISGIPWSGHDNRHDKPVDERGGAADSVARKI